MQALDKRVLPIEEACKLHEKISRFTTNNSFICYILGSFLLTNRCYTELTFSLLKKSVINNCEINANFRLVSYITQTQGFQAPLLLQYIKRLNGSKLRGYLNKKQLCLLFILSEQLSFPIHEDNINRLKNKFNKKLDVSLYFNRKVVLRSLFKYFNDYQIQSSEMYLDILKYRSKMENFFKENKNNFCIVGNGPSEIGSNNGTKIDKYKIVIRINNYNLELPSDYGKKVDVWFRVANDEVDNTNLHNQNKVIFVGNNFAVKRVDAYKYTLSCKLANCEYTCVPSYIFRDLILKLNTLPSTGLVILYWIYKVTGKKIPRANLYGFSHLSIPENNSEFKSHYYKDNVLIKNHIHDFCSEIPIFMDITE